MDVLYRENKTEKLHDETTKKIILEE